MEGKKTASQDRNNQKQMEYVTRRRVKSNQYVTDDPNAPLLYTPFQMGVFSMLASMLAASILLRMNLCQVNQQRRARLLIITSIIVQALLMFSNVDRFIPISMVYVYVIVNYLLFVIMHHLFWKRYMPEDMLFRKRKMLKPILIFLGTVLVIMIYFFAFYIYG